MCSVQCRSAARRCRRSYLLYHKTLRKSCTRRELIKLISVDRSGAAFRRPRVPKTDPINNNNAEQVPRAKNNDTLCDFRVEIGPNSIARGILLGPRSTNRNRLQKLVQIIWWKKPRPVRLCRGTIVPLPPPCPRNHILQTTYMQGLVRKFAAPRFGWFAYTAAIVKCSPARRM